MGSEGGGARATGWRTVLFRVEASWGPAQDHADPAIRRAVRQELREDGWMRAPRNRAERRTAAARRREGGR